jgi:hypothetical protein
VVKKYTCRKILWIYTPVDIRRVGIYRCCAPFERTAPYKEILPEND